jgi:hypothetical protein
MQCCNATGTRGVYDLWRYAVAEIPRVSANGRVIIHLRFSVQTPTIRVVSHEPTEGRLDITAFADRDVKVRLPEGTDRAIAVRPHGEETVLAAVDGYAVPHPHRRAG